MPANSRARGPFRHMWSVPGETSQLNRPARRRALVHACGNCSAIVQISALPLDLGPTAMIACQRVQGRCAVGDPQTNRNCRCHKAPLHYDLHSHAHGSRQ